MPRASTSANSEMLERPTLAITVGEPAGIGPELCAKLALRHAEHAFAARLVLVGDHGVLSERAQRIGLSPRYAEYDPVAFAPAGGVVEVWHHPVAAPVLAGRPDPTNAHNVLRMLQNATDACATGAFAAMVTGPMQKSVMMDAGIPFTGHTEYLAERTHTPRVVMMLVGGTRAAPLRVALVTTHLPLAEVPRALTKRAVVETLAIVARALREQFGIATPRIAVCGLNPHAGEGGHLGREEIDVIAPAMTEAARDRHRTVCRAAPRRHGVRARTRARLTTPWSRCITTRGCRCSRRRASGSASTLRSACRFRARRSITARRSTLRSMPSARRRRIPEASSRRSILAIGLVQRRNAGA